MKCPYCRFSYSSHENLVRHLAHSHKWRYGHALVCQCCEKSFMNKTKAGNPFERLCVHLETCEPFLHLRCVSEITGGVPE